MPEFDFGSLTTEPIKEEKKTIKLQEIKDKIKNYSKKGLTVKEAYEIVIKQAEITEKKLEELIYEKKKELKGLISDEGALFIVAKQFGIDLPTKYKPETKKEEAKLIISEPIDDFFVEIESEKKVEKPKLQPKITKPEIKLNKTDQYPLVPIDIKEENKLSLTEAKQKVLNDIELYNFTINNIVNEKDFATIQGKKFLCKSGVRKIQLALGISTKIIREQTFKDDKQWVSKFIVKAIAPSGRYATSIGVCEQNEKGRSRTLHDTIAMAQTRATSRAILDLVGFGAVSAGEIDDSKDSNLDVLDLVGK